MAKFQLLLPKMGESVAEATVINWLKKPGDYIEADDTVVEIATDKVDSEVPSPVAGRLVEQLFKKDDVVQVGEAIAIIETGDDDTTQSKPTETQTTQATPPPAASPQTTVRQPFDIIPGLAELERKAASAQAQPVAASAGRFYSPLVRTIAAQERVPLSDLDAIPGTGADGRLTKDDLLAYVRNKKQPAPIKNVTPEPATQVPPPAAIPAPEPVSEPEPPISAEQEVIAPAAGTATSLNGNEDIIEMDRMRRLIAEHMVKSKEIAVHVSSFVEADVTNLVYWREKNKQAFEERENEKMTFTPLFIEAVVKAIQDFPMINVSVSGTQIIKKKNINIGMATALPNGNLIVPVIHDAANLDMVSTVKAVNDLAARARINKLKPDEVRYGTFTITNIGGFGNVMGTPIINQPQVAILAIGAIKKKPAVLETPTGDVIAIRHMMFLSLSYDHRVVDGSLGGSFLKRIADYLENWDINRTI